MYPYVVKTTCYDQDLVQKPLNFLIYASGFAAAAREIESLFGPDLASIYIYACGEEGDVFEVNEEIADVLINGFGNYEEGLKYIAEKNRTTPEDQSI